MSQALTIAVHAFKPFERSLREHSVGVGLAKAVAEAPRGVLRAAAEEAWSLA